MRTNCGCSEIRYEPFEFNIIDNSNNLLTCSNRLPSYNSEDYCKLLKKIICDFTDVIKKLECGIQPNIEIILEEISLIHMINGCGISKKVSGNEENVSLQTFGLLLELASDEEKKQIMKNLGVLDELTSIIKIIYCKTYNKIHNDIKFLSDKLTELEQLFKSILKDNQVGIPVINKFGDDEYIGVSQKTLTDALNKLWDKIESMTGEISQGIYMTVNPEYFIGEDGCNVDIQANSIKANGIFEHIAFYKNGILIDEADNVETFNTSTHIDETTEIKCVAKILGIEYTKSEVVTHYNSFWLFTGNYKPNELENVMKNESNTIPIINGMRGTYDINCNLGDHIYIILGKSLSEGFIRADMNSIEIPFNKDNISINDNNFVVYTSTNTFNAGTYNIDING